jgi:hypothetical protein
MFQICGLSGWKIPKKTLIKFTCKMYFKILI